MIFKVSDQAKLVGVANGVPFETRVLCFESPSTEAELINAIDDFAEAAMMKILADPAVTQD